MSSNITEWQKYKYKILIEETLTLYIKEDNLLAISIVILRAYDVLSSVFQLNSIDDEGIIVTVVPFHEFDGLS